MNYIAVAGEVLAATETAAEELDAAEGATSAFQFNSAGDSTEHQGEYLGG